MSGKLIDLEARLIHETQKARLFDFGDSDPVWLPKSQHEWDKGERLVTLPERIALDKGLI